MDKFSHHQSKRFLPQDDLSRWIFHKNNYKFKNSPVNEDRQSIFPSSNSFSGHFEFLSDSSKTKHDSCSKFRQKSRFFTSPNCISKAMPAGQQAGCPQRRSLGEIYGRRRYSMPINEVDDDDGRSKFRPDSPSSKLVFGLSKFIIGDSSKHRSISRSISCDGNDTNSFKRLLQVKKKNDWPLFEWVKFFNHGSVTRHCPLKKMPLFIPQS